MNTYGIPFLDDAGAASLLTEVQELRHRILLLGGDPNSLTLNVAEIPKGYPIFFLLGTRIVPSGKRPGFDRWLDQEIGVA